MTQQTRRVCDECQGVIPEGAPCITSVSATLVLATGSQPYANLDFCSTAHMAAYIQAQPQVANPVTPYAVIPAQ